MLKKLTFKPGINRESTQYAEEGTYWDGNLVRFRFGRPQGIYGWAPYLPDESEEFVGACRLLMPYVTVDNAKLLAIGTNAKFYVEYGGTLYDITPIASTSSLTTNSILTSEDSADVFIYDAAVSAQAGDFVLLSGFSSAVNGIPAASLNGVHEILGVTGGSDFNILVDTPATSSGFSSVAFDVGYDISRGGDIYTIGTGWGAGAWSRDAWGSAAELGVGIQLRLWSASNYGDALVYGPRGGGLYYWDYDAGTGLSTRGELISGMVGANEVPTSQNYILVSDQSRFVITLGSNDFGSADANPMLIRWSDQENFLEWEPRATTQAGSQLMSSGSALICAKQTQQEILVWSDTAVFSMQYSGPPYIFNFSTLAENTSIISPNAAVVVNNVAYWMGKDKFYVYSGQVRVLPCDVRSYVFDDMNKDQTWQVTCGVVDQYNEVWWYYCANGEEVNGRYVVYNYEENIWYFGRIARTSWIDSGLYQYPIATSYSRPGENEYNGAGKLFNHEFGLSFPDVIPIPFVTQRSFIETAAVDVDDGERLAFIRSIVPDIEFAGSTVADTDTGEISPELLYTIIPGNYPGDASSASSLTGAYNKFASVTPGTFGNNTAYSGRMSVRIRARQIRLRFGSIGDGVAWKAGDVRIDYRPDGRK